MTAKQRTVIIGGGVIGASTAFFMSRHPKFDAKTHEIIILEATATACAASGKAGGLLSKTAFPQNLGPLSYKLHQKLAAEFDGENRWGYRKVSIMSLEASDRSEKESAVELPKELNWIKKDMIEYVEALGEADEFAQVHPYWFTDFMIQHTKEKGVLEVITGKVSEINANEKGECTGVTYVSGRESKDTKFLRADNVIVCAGPWTSKLVGTCPIVGMKVPSITVAPTEQVSAFALFTELELDGAGHVAPEIYARKNEIYICGETIDDPLPEYASDITVDDSYGDSLFAYGGALSEEIAGGKIKRRQACYLPVVDSPYTSGPFVGKTNVSNLLLAAGHTCWGINNAPATGLLMAETLLDGKAHTSNIKSLNPASYFDAAKGLTLKK